MATLVVLPEDRRGMGYRKRNGRVTITVLEGETTEEEGEKKKEKYLVTKPEGNFIRLTGLRRDGF